MSDGFYLWGTGELAKTWLSKHKKDNVIAFVDPSLIGTYEGLDIITPQELIARLDFNVLICSSAWTDILNTYPDLPEKARKLSIFTPSGRTISLADCVQIPQKGHYFLPWQNSTADWQSALSNEIVFPDAYRELAKSVAYSYISSVEGDIAEFGTCSGYTASFIANSVDYYTRSLASHEAMHNQQPRKLHLFDSFQGFPASTQEADIDSPHVASGAWGEGTAKGLSSKELLDLCENFLSSDRIDIYEGWYKETLRDIKPETRFAMVHLDCDLFESTYDVLNALLENNHLSEGAILLFDNWFCNRASPDFGEQKAWNQILNKFDVEYTNLGIYAANGNRIIIHSYKKRV